MEYESHAIGEAGMGNMDPTQYGNDYAGGDYLPADEFSLINSVICDGLRKDDGGDIGVSTLAFDSVEELLWMGTKTGHVTSYYGTQLQKYTSFQVHPSDEVRNILTLDHGILALTQTSLRSQIRRGIPLFTHTSENMLDMHSLLYNRISGKILMGGMQEKLLEFDLATACETRSESTEGGSCAILREHSRFICCGDASQGKILLRDPRTLEVQHTLEAHKAGLSDFDVHGHHLVTCGQSMRRGISHIDRFLMVYDVRMMRAVNPIQANIHPFQLRFLPALSSRLVVLSSLGQVQMLDTAALSAPQYSFFQVGNPVEGCSTISMDISPSNQCLGFGDTTNWLHLYCSVAEPVLNPFARETEFADQPVQLPPIDMTDKQAIYSSIARPHLPPGQTSYASDYWPERFARTNVFRPTPQVDPEILKTMRVVGTVGYARNPGKTKRNQVLYPNVHGIKDAHERHEGRRHPLVERGGSLSSTIPNAYRKVAIKLSKMGSDDFDFDRYNRTGFCGLEASLPNSYCNSMLQILYYTERLRVMILNHTCDRENCICCELSFLFHMMDISPGMPCHSGNFLRAMRTIPEAAALGLIFTDQSSVWNSNVSRLMQSWNRFILHQISTQAFPKDSDKQQSLFLQLFGMQQEKTNSCSKCKNVTTSEDTVLLCNLLYPEESCERETEVSFEQVVCSSLCPEQSTPAWCERCRKYQPTLQHRTLRSMPHVLSLNAGMDNQQDLDFWGLQMQLLLQKLNPQAQQSSEDKENNFQQQQQQAPPNLKACRYGLGCNRPDCKFWHPLQQNESQEESVANKLAKLGKSWVPRELRLVLLSDGKVVAEEDPSALSGQNEILDRKTYHLYAVCSVIKDSQSGAPLNIVAAINVGPQYHARIASPVSQWYVFNDFSINTIMAEESVWFDLSWKVPCLLFYESTEDALEPLRSLSFFNPLTSSVFREDASLAAASSTSKGKRITFTPLAAHEMPASGDLVAIDAEFVTLNQEESELRSDGKVSTIKAAQMSVARITCVRGGGPSEGVPFIDDYISTQEQVVDYVTKFSGIKPGDLDANFSSKHLTTLKSTYKKLRYLVDTGCVFIGHGLKNDFKVINLVVPAEQVIDTVHIFHLPHNRMVSLKFLAWHFLGKKIQGHTHDSIEDAVTALALYKKSLKLKEEGVFIDALGELYDKGKECNWKIPDDQEEGTK